MLELLIMLIGGLLGIGVGALLIVFVLAPRYERRLDAKLAAIDEEFATRRH